MEGTSLAAVLRGSKGPLPEPVAAALVQRLLRSLEAAHAASPPVFQRDLSPKSVVLEGKSVSVLPFDAARASGVHMSPEQAHGQVLDARSDVFSVGALLFELVCGRPPAPSVMALALGELDAPDPSLSAPMKAVLERGLKLAPVERFASASELAAALDTVPPSPDALDAWLAAAPVQKEEARAGQPAAAAMKPRHLAVTVTAVGLVALLGATVTGLEYAEHRHAVKQAAYEATLRTCGVVSEPTGAQISLDGWPQPERTPAVLKLEPGREYVVEVRGAAGSVVRRVRDEKLLSVRLQGTSSGVIEEESWNAPASPPEEDDARDPGPQAAVGEFEARRMGAHCMQDDVGPMLPTATFDVEAAPGHFTLTPEHEVLISQSLCRTAAAGTWKLTREPLVFRALSGGRLKPSQRVDGHLGSRTLGLFVLDARTGRVELMPTRLDSKVPRTLCPFALTDRTLETTAMQPALELPGTASEELKGGVINVPYDARLLVRSLRAKKAWRVTVSPVQVPYAVMIVRSATGLDHLFVLDHSEVNVPVGSESVWFTVPVLQRQNLNLKLSVEER